MNFDVRFLTAIVVKW